MKIVRNSIWKKRDMDGTFWPVISQWFLFFLKHLKQQIVSLMMTKTWSVGWFGLVNPQLKTLSDDQYNIHKHKRWKYLAWINLKDVLLNLMKRLKEIAGQKKTIQPIGWDYHAPRVHFAASMIPNGMEHIFKFVP